MSETTIENILRRLARLEAVKNASDQEVYTVTNVITDRAYDANSTTLDEIADVLGTLLNDLRAKGLIV